jgi:predicted RNA methylase
MVLLIWKTKMAPVAPAVQKVLSGMKIERRDGGFAGLLIGQLDRPLYVDVARVIELMGGKWQRRERVHVFVCDPRPQIEQIMETGNLIVIQDSFFQTPRPVVDAMLALVPIPDKGLILEPSAGVGAIADVLAEHVRRERIICVEAQPQRADVLRRKGYEVAQLDFLDFCDGPYARVFMNPPFERGQDAAHVRHAYDLLSKDGILVAVMAEGVFFRQDKSSVAFREWFHGIGGYAEELPDRSFASSGTDVCARLVVMDKE